MDSYIGLYTEETNPIGGATGGTPTPMQSSNATSNTTATPEEKTDKIPEPNKPLPEYVNFAKTLRTQNQQAKTTFSDDNTLASYLQDKLSHPDVWKTLDALKKIEDNKAAAGVKPATTTPTGSTFMQKAGAVLNAMSQGGGVNL